MRPQFEPLPRDAAYCAPPKADTYVQMTMNDWIVTLKTGRFVLLLFFATQAVYLVMLLFTLPHLQQLAGGMKPFDLLPQGYDSNYAISFMEVIGDDGRTFYLTRQIPLDLIYPGLFAITFAAMWLWLLDKIMSPSSVWRWGALLPMLAGFADYIENGLIVAMLTSYPDTSKEVVTAANLFTILKSMATALFFFALLCLVIVIGIQKYENRKV